ncbi:MAG: hypothetical protein WA688_04720 [Thermoplasmata archaeon]
MNSIEASVLPNHRTQRVVSLPCGHQVRVGLDASMLALSGPVLDHQTVCRAERPPTFAAWFSVDPLSSAGPEALVVRHSTPGGFVP